MKTRSAALILISILTSMLPASARAQATNPPYLSQMPSAARVKAEIKGADALDTAARQAAAFWHLIWIIRDLNGPRNVYQQVTPDAQRLINAYHSNQMWYSLKENAPPAQHTQRWVKLREFYENDLRFLDEVLQQLFTPEFRAGYYRATRKQPPPGRSAKAPPVAAGTRPRPGAPADTNAKAHFEQGQKYYQAKDYPKAVEAYKKAIALNPAYADAYHWLALTLTYRVRGQEQLAISAWKQYLDIGAPGTGLRHRVLLGLGKAHENAGQYDEALNAYRTLISLKPEATILADAHLFSGSTYIEMNQYENAVSAYQEALRINPDAYPSRDLGIAYEAYASRDLGIAYYHLKQYPKAVESLQQAVRLKPDNTNAQVWLGFAYVRLGKKGEALQVYGTLQTLDQEQARRLYDEINAPAGAAAANKGGQPANRPAGSAKTSPPSAPAETGEKAEASLRMGDRYYEVEDYAEAIEFYKEAIALNPSLRDAHFGLGQVYDKQEQYQLAINAFRQGLALQPADPEQDANILILLGLAHGQLKQYREALGAYRRAIGLRPEAEILAVAHRFMGDAYYHLEQYPNALAAFQQALRVDPNFVAAHYGLGFTYLALGRKSEAQQVYQRLVSLDKAAAQRLLEAINDAP